MSTNENVEDWADEAESGVDVGRGSRDDAPGGSKSGRDGISVSKGERANGATVTTVKHPPRRLKTPGEIKKSYESGEIDLNEFIRNAQEGLNAMRPVVLTHTKGSGKDRETWQSIEMVPDMDARLRWQNHVTETVEGMPVKRQEIVSKKLTTEEDFIAMLRKSKALRKSVRSVLDKIEGDEASDAADEHSNKRGDES